MNIGIYIYKNAEVLDFSGPFEVFSTALRLSPLAGISKVFLVAEKHRRVIARGGNSVNYHRAGNPLLIQLSNTKGTGIFVPPPTGS